MSKKTTECMIFFWCLALLFGTATNQRAMASGLTILPVRLELSSDRGVGAFSITNDSDQSVTLDVRAMQWTQANGEDRMSDTRELLVTPPIFTLASGATQIVRVGLRRAPDASSELTYRLFVTEVPSANARAKFGVTMSLRLSVPIFVRPTSTAAPAVEWSLVRHLDGSISLQAFNAGSMHSQVADLRLTQAGKLIATHAEPAYLLAGQRRELRLTVEPDADFSTPALKLVGYSDAGSIRTEVKAIQPVAD